MNHFANETPGPHAVQLPDFERMRTFLATVPAEAATAADVFQTVDWFEHLADQGFVGGVAPWLLGATGANTAERCVLPLARVRGGVASLSNYYSSLFGALGTPSPALWRVLAQTLRHDAAGATVRLQPFADDVPGTLQLHDALRRAGYWVDRFECFGNWYLPVAHADFAAYFASLPSPLRHSIERGRRRLARADSSLAIHRAPGPALDAAIAAFEEVYRQSWKAPEPLPGFMPGLVRMAARLGWLRLGVLHVQGRPVAAQVWLVKDGKANIYKLAYVQGFEKLSPGSVLTAALMAHAMDVDRVREVDYLTGDDAYKRDWMSHRRVRVGLVAFDWRRPRGLLAATRHFGGRAVRRLQGLLRR